MASNKLKSYIGYNPTNVNKYTQAEQRAAYGKLRAIANKRIEKLQRHGYGDIQAVTDITRMFGSARVPKISELKNTDVSEALTEVSHFLRSMTKVSQIHSYERQQVKNFKQMGFKKINAGNLKKFGEFMERLRERYGARMRDSFRAVRAFEAAERLHINPDVLMGNLDNFNTDLDIWEKVQPFEARERGYSAYNYRKRYREALAKYGD